MAINNTKPQMIRYDDLVVKLYRLTAKTNIFGYKDPFEGDGVIGTEYPITIERIIYSSDTAPTTLSGTITDLSISYHINMVGGKEFSNSSSNYIPEIGWGITVDVKGDGRYLTASATEKGASQTRIFKGYIFSISRQIGQNGIFYRFEARDIKSRLT